MFFSQRNKALGKAQRDRVRKVRELESRYKRLAAFIPPVLPLVLALLVYLHRRRREREGLSAARLR